MMKRWRAGTVAIIGAAVIAIGSGAAEAATGYGISGEIDNGGNPTGTVYGYVDTNSVKEPKRLEDISLNLVYLTCRDPGGVPAEVALSGLAFTKAAKLRKRGPRFHFSVTEYQYYSTGHSRQTIEGKIKRSGQFEGRFTISGPECEGSARFKGAKAR